MPKVRAAFDLQNEPAAVRDRYGRTRFGRSCLTARRLVAAGVRFVTANMFETVFDELTGDIHGSKPFTDIQQMADTIVPTLDKAYSALLEHLSRRALLSHTMVVATGEFGRTPKVDPAGGGATTPASGPCSWAAARSRAAGWSARATRPATPRRPGRPLVVEVETARLGSPLDSLVEMLYAAGKPVPRAVLRGLARASTTLRDHDARGPGVRLDAWNGFAVDDFVLAGTELMRIKAMPPGPDDDCQFDQADGRRVGFLGTTPTAHAFGTDVYKVAVEPPGTTVRPNGLPAVTLPYRNDDGGPGFGRDSWLRFTPPTDGEYRVRLSDANGSGSPLHAYRLTVREPRPDFTIKVGEVKKLPAGGAATLTVTATRTDGFDGPIRLTADGVPDSVIEAGQLTAMVPVTGGDSVQPSATADISGQEVRREATAELPKPTPPADVTATTDRPGVSIKPGGEVRLTVRVKRLPGFTGRVPVEVRGLPHGVRGPNIGLNGILLTPNVPEREMVIPAEPWVKPGTVPFAVVARSENTGAEFAVPVTLATL